MVLTTDTAGLLTATENILEQIAISIRTNKDWSMVEDDREYPMNLTVKTAITTKKNNPSLDRTPRAAPVS